MPPSPPARAPTSRSDRRSPLADTAAQALGAVGAVAALAGVVRFARRAGFEEPRRLEVRHLDLALPRWPAGAGRLRCLFLTDFHCGSPWNGLDRLRQIVRCALVEEADLILLGGDYVSGHVLGGRFVPPEAIASVLAELKAPLGVWAVLGNHDYYIDAHRVRAALEAVGVPVLHDAAHFFAPSERLPLGLWLLGISDFLEDAHDVEAALAAQRALREQRHACGLPTPDDAPTVVLTHSPDVFPTIPDAAALTVAGHTHGGQVVLPGLGAPAVPSIFGRRYLDGHLVEDGRHLVVSRGLG
ncbi:MAG: metallophosphoesterase, partial [Acidobacteriota bacterium]